jgi:hypothetical protein
MSQITILKILKYIMYLVTLLGYWLILRSVPEQYKAMIAGLCISVTPLYICILECFFLTIIDKAKEEETRKNSERKKKENRVVDGGSY